MGKRVAIVGAGSWGTALAIHSVNCGHSVELLVHGKDTLAAILETGENSIYLPGFPLPSGVKASADKERIAGCDYVIFAVPSIHFRQSFLEFRHHLSSDSVLVSAIKGMEPETSKRISEIVQELCPVPIPYSVLSGPSFALEVAKQHPTAVVIGSTVAEVGRQIQHDFSTPYFRLYYNSDVLGIEIGASVKNIIAIAAGVVSGLGYGYNTTSGLITRGLTELNRLAVYFGAQPSTLAGLAGLGDLILTCMGHLSRNRQVGVELGHGKTVNEIVSKTRMVAEGIRTTQAIRNLAIKHSISMPITEQVYRLLYENHSPRSAILELMMRELKEE